MKLEIGFSDGSRILYCWEIPTSQRKENIMAYLSIFYGLGVKVRMSVFMFVCLFVSLPTHSIIRKWDHVSSICLTDLSSP